MSLDLNRIVRGTNQKPTDADLIEDGESHLLGIKRREQFGLHRVPHGVGYCSRRHGHLLPTTTTASCTRGAAFWLRSDQGPSLSLVTCLS
ncbi:hypothetical protein PVK06_026188 [Gossypium arboreum]|uniref:Uncharacterized protein n=1 Tax=Gossypium arboreum TaxID=29729 RepID=A0ABR0NX17_GOSAR|nr:hypothetical protein PVK06_026188 [Gossypium arboreum]